MALALRQVSLDDKYQASEGRIFVTGTQALVRLALVQRRRDQAAGLDTRGFICGYRGSPLGGLDQALDQAKKAVAAGGLRFQPGVNEDLAATAIWGTQQVNIVEKANTDGVFAYWYGKGPGVDRSGDAFRHGNLAGSAPKGGVVLLLGDDHTCKSSTTSHQSEYAMVDAMIPVLNPAGIAEIIPFGLYATALSRFSGLWTSLKLIAETMDSSASISTEAEEVAFVEPAFEPPPGGLHIRWPDMPQEQERRLHNHKVPAALAFARANRIDRVVLSGPGRRVGIVTTGKSYLDVRQALDELGLDEARAMALGLSLYKVGMSWPLEPEGLRAFAEGLETLLVVEEKRPLIEGQIKDQLFDLPHDRRPTVLGKLDAHGHVQLPAHDDLNPIRIARVIGQALLAVSADAELERRLGRLAEAEAAQGKAAPPAVARTPYFCSGCPHSTSTRIPEGSRGMAGIGCSWMSLWMDRGVSTFTHMGAEGANWIGQAPFVPTRHVFQTLGDGTYFHSGLLAIRAAVSAKVNITYKILFNDAVAMTGGQRHDGTLSPDRIAAQVRAEGVERVAIVSEDPDRHPAALYPPGTTIHHRDDLDAVQRELREVEGVSAIVYDQTCAAEKRRRRKRNLMPDPDVRVLVNELVCEGCGDCSKKSNCLSVTPIETEFGVKRRIDQSSCNKDVSCVKGFCPSFVTVEGAVLKKPGKADLKPLLARDLPEPVQVPLDRPWNILVTGVGGTGVVTIGAVLAMAAHVEGKGCSTLDMTGMAQKGGPVTSHLRLARSQDELHAVRIAQSSADLVLGCDAVTATGKEAKSVIGAGRSRVVLNLDETITADFIRDRDFRVGVPRLVREVRATAGDEAVLTLDASRLAESLLGDSIGANMMMVGYAVQAGLVPLSIAAIERAIELNGAAVEMNKAAFRLGRLAAVDAAALERATPRTDQLVGLEHRQTSASLAEVVERRAAFLRDYQDDAYAERYRARIGRVIEAERRVGGRSGALAMTAARNLFKLMAYKDEYEVARLYSGPAFQAQLAETFASHRRIKVHLAPPLLSPLDPATGEPRKRAFGPWVLKLFPLLARFKGLRGGRLDLFGYTHERRAERALVTDYEALLDRIADQLTPQRLDAAVALASYPDEIRGFGPVKERAMAKAAAARPALEAAFAAPVPLAIAAE